MLLLHIAPPQNTQPTPSPPEQGWSNAFWGILTFWFIFMSNNHKYERQLWYIQNILVKYLFAGKSPAPTMEKHYKTL